MIISIASGKGGTGKTTVATNLAVSLGSAVQLLDCDVEEPNAHLFMHPVFDLTETVTTPVPEVDMNRYHPGSRGGYGQMHPLRKMW
jgi:MinD superfamily P-loop ATPase